MGDVCSGRILCEIDDFLESRGLYRKIVPKESNSLYLALSDLLYLNQKAAQGLQKALGYRVGSHKEEELQFLAARLGHRIQLIRSPSNISTYGSAPKTLMLCNYQTPNHFDPIFTSSKIQSLALAQSIVYELLYESVFQLKTTMEASSLMLQCDNPQIKKPTLYDKNFSGTALQAIEKDLIPFPYKVAKALDVRIYRNIDYDVWSIKDPKASGKRTPCANKNDLETWMGKIGKGISKGPYESYTLTRLDYSNSKEEEVRDKTCSWLKSMDFTLPPPPHLPRVVEGSHLIVKEVYPIMGDCPTSPRNCSCDESNGKSSSLLQLPDTQRIFKRIPQPLVIPMSINSHCPGLSYNSPLTPVSPVSSGYSSTGGGGGSHSLSPLFQDISISPTCCSYVVLPKLF